MTNIYLYINGIFIINITVNGKQKILASMHVGPLIRISLKGSLPFKDMLLLTEPIALIIASRLSWKIKHQLSHKINDKVSTYIIWHSLYL